MAYPRTFLALENPRFRLLWFGNIFSFLGMQMQVIARGYLAFELTHKNSALGGVMLAFGVPQLLLSLWGGVIADRLPKRRVLMVCQVIIASNSAWVAAMIYTDHIAYWMLIVAGVVQGAGFSFIGPARQAFISDLVEKDHLGNAVVLQQLSMNSTRVIGPSIAGMFIAIQVIGTGGVYLMTTLGFVVATIFMIWLPPGNPHRGVDDSSAMSDLKDGLRYVMARRDIGLLILASFAVVMMGFSYQSFLPSLAVDVYHSGAGGLGTLSSVGAIGAVVATVIVAGATQKRSFIYQPLAGLLFGVALVGLGVAPSLAAGLFAMVFVGAMASAFQSLNNSLVMTITDVEYHGRVQSMNMMSWSLFGLASLPIGVMADRIGIQEMMILQGLFCVVAIVVIEFVRRTGHAGEPRPPTVTARSEGVAGGR